MGRVKWGYRCLSRARWKPFGSLSAFGCGNALVTPLRKKAHMSEEKEEDKHNDEKICADFISFSSFQVEFTLHPHFTGLDTTTLQNDDQQQKQRAPLPPRLGIATAFRRDTELVWDAAFCGREDSGAAGQVGVGEVGSGEEHGRAGA
eukprot:evm.model.NODE_2196_length_2696_cov_33.662464.2